MWHVWLSLIYCVTQGAGTEESWFDLFPLPPDKVFLTFFIAKHLSHFLPPVVFRHVTPTALSICIFPLFQSYCYFIPWLNENIKLYEDSPPFPLAFSLRTRSRGTSRLPFAYGWWDHNTSCQTLINYLSDFKSNVDFKKCLKTLWNMGCKYGNSSMILWEVLCIL